MTRPIDLMRQGRKEELWQMCCGFLDLSLEQFMTIQKRLLLEQIELLWDFWAPAILKETLWRKSI